MFLDQAITFLKQYEDRYEVALLYISDHGESLGENGLYLHGLPYVIAPDAQKHIAALFWLGKGFKDINISILKDRAVDKYSHDNIFSTLLGIFDVNTSLYNSKDDILKF
jgi:lipid A ethanolaminephosphotransferase